jgi:hypothetical protein
MMNTAAYRQLRDWPEDLRYQDASEGERPLDRERDVLPRRPEGVSVGSAAALCAAQGERGGRL